MIRVATLALVVALTACAAQSQDIARLTAQSIKGDIIAVEDTLKFPFAEQPVKNDNGYNVLIDVAHQCNFSAMWHLPGLLWNRGYRAIGSHATLDTVLKPGEPVCVRANIGERRPFSYWPNTQYNVVITFQTSDAAAPYLKEEIDALEAFVRDGGGLVIAAGSRATDIKTWTLSALAARFDARLSGEQGMIDKRRVAGWTLGKDWTPEIKAVNDQIVVARRKYGKGNVVVLSDLDLIAYRANKDAAEAIEVRGKRLDKVLAWATEGVESVGGTTKLPKQQGGAAAIYPELTKQIGNIRLFYARNALPELLDYIENDIPVVTETVMAWIPSPTFDTEPINLLLAAGGGGGWAVNAYLPKEAGCISPAPVNLMSVYAHELTHTLSGPANDDGGLAGLAPHGNKGEAHAGWFQTKALFLFTNGEKLRDSNSIFKADPDLTKVDLAGFFAYSKGEHPVGVYRNKVYYIWQKLDERYGPEWYPRWRWGQHTRWADDPEHKLTWTEMVEDMSIAVGEDLFPFMTKIGTTLDKDRLEQIKFNGKTVKLPVADIELTKVGTPVTKPLGDWRK